MWCLYLSKRISAIWLLMLIPSAFLLKDYNYGQLLWMFGRAFGLTIVSFAAIVLFLMERRHDMFTGPRPLGPGHIAPE